MIAPLAHKSLALIQSTPPQPLPAQTSPKLTPRLSGGSNQFSAESRPKPKEEINIVT